MLASVHLFAEGNPRRQKNSLGIKKCTIFFLPLLLPLTVLLSNLGLFPHPGLGKGEEDKIIAGETEVKEKKWTKQGMSKVLERLLSFFFTRKRKRLCTSSISAKENWRTLTPPPPNPCTTAPDTVCLSELPHLARGPMTCCRSGAPSRRLARGAGQGGSRFRSRCCGPRARRDAESWRCQDGKAKATGEAPQAPWGPTGTHGNKVLILHGGTREPSQRS